MHIDNLKYFYKVAQAKSISTVAKESHISQSALSQQLLKLENNLNVKLLVRSNKGVSLTKEGEIVYNHCEVILNTYNKMTEELESINSKRNLITIDGCDALISTLIPLSIQNIKKYFPKYNLKLISSELTSNNLLNSISDINIDFFSYGTSPTILSKELFEDKIVFVTNSTFLKDTISIDEFLSHQFIMVNDKINLKEHILDVLLSKDKSISSLKILFNTNTYQSALIALRNNNAITAIPYSLYNIFYKDFNLKTIEVENLDFPLTMYMNYSEQLYNREKLFVDRLTKILKGFLKS